ncbi:MAG TPA: diguanylate cyclase [Luteimonas sp.]
MEPVATDSTRARATVFGSPRVRAGLPGRVYRYRMLGMALGALAMAVVLWELRAGPLRWGLCVFTGLLWPQIAYLLARRSPDPFRAEQRSLMVDSAITAFWIPLLHFNLLPSVLLLALPAADKVNSDIPGIFRRTIPLVLGALLLGGLCTGFAFEPSSSTAVILACLPMLLIHTTIVSLARRKLLQKVLEKNQELDLLGRVDRVTGLSLRGHWERDAAHALHAVHALGRPTALLLIDVDGFKRVNDHNGHIAGDALLRAAGATLTGMLRPGDFAGRYGGDEFAVVCPATTLDDAARLGEAYRAAVERIELPEAPGQMLSVSIGIAQASANHSRIEQWIHAADAALYEAKRRGRNRLVVSAGDAPAAHGRG